MKKSLKRKIIKIGKWSWVPIVFIVTPLISITFAGCHEAVVRLSVLSVLLPLGSMVICWYALSPRTQMIKSSAKLNRSEYSDKTRRRITLGLRVFFFLLGLGLLGKTFQFGRDVVLLMLGQETKIVKGHLVVNNTPFGMWFASQGIVLDEGNGPEKNYILLYSPKRRLRLDTYYEFKVLPHSKLILEAKELKKEETNTQQ